MTTSSIGISFFISVVPSAAPIAPIPNMPADWGSIGA
jgi:hypothetical protein